MEFWFELGYLGMFLAAFLAATILPLGSEPLLVAMAYADYNTTLLLWSATLGNTLGGLTTFGLGYLGKWKWIESLLKIPEKKLVRAKTTVEKYGIWAALLTWVPIVGDPIALVLGFFRLTWWKVLVLMFIGKLGRYWFIIYLME